MITLTAVRPGDPAALPAEARSQFDNLHLSRWGELELETFNAALRRDLGVQLAAITEDRD